MLKKCVNRNVDSPGSVLEPAAYFGTPPPIQTPGEVAGALQFNGSTDFLMYSRLWSLRSGRIGDFSLSVLSLLICRAIRIGLLLICRDI